MEDILDKMGKTISRRRSSCQDIINDLDKWIVTLTPVETQTLSKILNNPAQSNFSLLEYIKYHLVK